jgi:hypothetical protein
MLKNLLVQVSVGFLSLFFNCSLNEPVLPTWFVPINFPIIGETFKLGEIVNDSTIVVQGPDSLIFLSIEGEVDTTGLSREDLSVEPQDDSGAINLDLINFDSLSSLSTDVRNLRNLIPGLDTLVGQSIIIPEMTIEQLVDAVQSDDFKRIHVKSGKITVSVRNNLPFPIGPNSTHNSIQFEVINDSLNQSVANLEITKTILPGDSGQAVHQIGGDGVWVYSRLRISYSIPIAQATQVLVTDSLLDNSGFWFELKFEDLKADTAIAKIGSQTFSDRLKFRLENVNKIKRGEIEKGRIELNLQNNLPVGTNIVFTLPNIKNALNGQFTDSLQINENGSDNFNIILDNLIVLNPDDPNEFIDSAIVDFTVRTEGTENFVYITSEDEISVLFHSDTLFLKSFVGFLVVDSIKVPEIEEDSIADYRDFPRGVFLENASLELSLLSEILIENLFVYMKVTGYHEEDGLITDSADVEIAQTLTSNGTTQNPDVLNFSISGQEVADFLNILPTSIKATGTMSVFGNAEIVQNSNIWGDYSLSTPLRLKIENLDAIEGNVTTLDEGNIDDDITQITYDHIEGGSLILNLVNHTPLSGRVQFMISKDSSRQEESFFDTTSFNPALEITRSRTFTGAPVDPVTGFVTSPNEENLSIRLTKKEMKLLAQTPFRAAFKLKLFDTNGFVSLRSTDFVKVFGLARFNVRSDSD